MAQALSEILAQLDPVYNPQKAIIQQQQAALPGQQQAEQAGLDTAKTNAFGDINVQANDRGLSYSGMPIAEQAKYLGTSYLPAVAKLKTNYSDRNFSLQDTLAKLEADRVKQGQGIYTSQVNAEADAAAKVQAAQIAARASAAANPGLSLGGLGGGGGTPGAAAPQSIQQSLGQDIASLLNGYQQKYGAGYSERTALPKLYKLYPELSQDQIRAQFYGYRKQNYGE